MISFFLILGQKMVQNRTTFGQNKAFSSRNRAQNYGNLTKNRCLEHKNYRPKSKKKRKKKLTSTDSYTPSGPSDLF